MTASGALFPVHRRSVVVDRPLIAYAFLAQASHVHGDLLSGLTPIFRPIAKERAGRPFDSKEFATAVSKLYGIKISPWAVDDLAPRLEKAGLLSKAQIGPAATSYVYQPISDDFETVDESSVRLVVRRFVEYSKPFLSAQGISVSESRLEKFFLEQLISLDFHATLLKPNRDLPDPSVPGKREILALSKESKDSSEDQALGEQSRLNVLCAGFIVEIHRSNPALYEQVIKIATGALLSEVILNVQDPGNTASLLTLKLVLDGPFLMSFLNLSSEDSHFYAKELHNILSEKGAVFEVFRHSVDEIVSNLKAVRAGHQYGIGYGPTARRMRSLPFAKYVDSVIGMLDELLKRQKIRIIEVPENAAAYQYLSGTEEQEFYKSLGTFQNSLAQSRDAKSIAGIIRLRKGQTARMSHVYQAQYLFISENQFIVDQARDFVIGKKINKDGEVPPAVTDRYLAGLAWVLFGGKADEITQYQLLANCTAALEVRSDVQKRMLQFLNKLDESMASQFKAIMTTERGGQHLMQLTLGDPLLIKSTDDAGNILETLSTFYERKHKDAADVRVAEAIAEADRKNLAQIDLLRAEMAISVGAAVEAQEQANRRALDAATEALVAQQDRDATRHQLKKLTDDVERMRIAEEAREMEAILPLIREARRYAARLRMEITILASALAGWLGVSGSEYFTSI